MRLIDLVLAGLMVHIARWLYARLPEGYFSRRMARWIPTYLLVDCAFTLFPRVPGERRAPDLDILRHPVTWLASIQ